jgi:hypothetical protein
MGFVLSKMYSLSFSALSEWVGKAALDAKNTLSQYGGSWILLRVVTDYGGSSTTRTISSITKLSS